MFEDEIKVFDSQSQILNKRDITEGFVSKYGMDLIRMLKLSEAMDNKLELISKSISNIILKKSSVFLSELERVEILRGELNQIALSLKEINTLLHTYCKVLGQIFRCIKSCQNIQRKRCLTRYMNDIRSIYKSENDMKLRLQQKNFCEAIKLCLNIREQAQVLTKFLCVRQLSSKLSDSLDYIEESMDQTLGTTTYTCDMSVWDTGGIFQDIIQANVLLQKNHIALDQLLMHYTSSVHQNAYEALYKFYNPSDVTFHNSFTQKLGDDFNDTTLLHSTDSSHHPQFIQFGDLIQGINCDHLIPCLTEMLNRFLIIIMCFGKTINWYISHHFDPLKDDKKIDFSPSNKGPLNNLNMPLINENELDYTNYKIYTFHKLNHGIKRISQDMFTKLLIFPLKAKSAAEELPYTQYVQYMTLFLKFIAFINTVFNVSIPSDIHNGIKQHIIDYLYHYHKSQIDELKMHLENEGWNECPVNADFDWATLPEYAFLNQNISFPLDTYADNTNTQRPQTSMITNSISDNNMQNKGDDHHKNLNETSASNTNTQTNTTITYLTNVSQKLCGITQQNQYNNQLSISIDALDPQMIASKSFILQKGSVTNSVPKTTISSTIVGNETSNIIVVNSTLNVLRIAAKYLRILWLYPIVIECEIKQGIKQLYQLYFFTVYQCIIGKYHLDMVEHVLQPEFVEYINAIKRNVFANKTLSGEHSTNSEYAQNNMTFQPNGIDDIITDTFPSTYKIPVKLSDVNKYELTKWDNLQHLVQHIAIQTESLLYLAKCFAQMDHIILKYGKILKFDSTQDDVIINSQESSTIVTIITNDDISMCELLQKFGAYIIALYFFNYSVIMQQITTQVDWDLRELASRHNPYIDAICQRFTALLTVLKQLDNPKQPLITALFKNDIVTNCISVVLRTMVDGFSMIKKCSNEGRALMQLDFQHLLLSIQDMTNLREIPDREFLDNYIKAYYLGETDIEQWCTQHTEYSNKHLTALLMHMGHLTKKTRNKIIQLINTGQLSNKNDHNLSNHMTNDSTNIVNSNNNSSNIETQNE